MSNEGRSPTITNTEVKNDSRNATVHKEPIPACKSSDSNNNNNITKNDKCNNCTHLKLMCVMNVELSKGKYRQLELFRNKTPDEMAYEFCKDNDLDFKSMRNIAHQIKDKMRGVLKRETYSLSGEHSCKCSEVLSPKKSNNDVIYNKQRMNYGEYLYVKGKDQKTKVNEKIQKLKKQNEDTQTIELTFHPKLNRVKSFNAFKHQSPHITTSPTVKTIVHAHSKQRKTEQKGKSVVCKTNTTNANVNVNVNMNTVNNKTKPNVHPLTPQYTFRPKINSNYKVKTNFEERLREYLNTHNKKQVTDDINEEGVGKKKETLYDSTTGQILFKPKLVARNICKVNINPKNVFQINYEYASHYRRNKEELVLNANSQFNKVRFVPNDTNRIFTEKKIAAFKFIFGLLDSDEDGTISSININKKALDGKMEEIISPIITQIVQQKVVIEENDFVQAMDVLFNAVSVNEKNEILNVKKNYGKRKRDVLVVNGVRKERGLKNSVSELFEKRKNKYL